MAPRKCVLLFLRHPQKGEVKQRLAEDLDEETVLTLYKNFVLDTLATLDMAGPAVRIYYTPEEQKTRVIQWLGADRTYFPQQGADLGERMRNALADTFSGGYTQAALIGSDIPDLPATFISRALESGAYDAVIGPSFDGGYYLIGFRREAFLPEIFHKMPWGTRKVFENTMAVFRERRLRVLVLPRWRDIDTLEDVREFFSSNRKAGTTGSETMKFLLIHRKRMNLG